MPMTPGEIAAAPRHPQLMDPADPEELIAASIWWYPSLFPHRTAVMAHLLLCGGNGYEWNHAGQIRSVFAHLEPDYMTLEERLSRGDRDAGQLSSVLEDWERDQLEAAALVRGTARDRARVYGRVTVSRGTRSSAGWGLMAARPDRVHPRWEALLEEAGRMFGQAWAAQDSAEATLRGQWERNPAARAAQLLTRQLGRAWTADDVTDAELAACDQLLATWRHPGWPSHLDRDHLAQQRDRSRAQRALARQILAELAAEGQLPTVPPATRAASLTGSANSPNRGPYELLAALATERLATVSRLVRPVPFTGWLEWEWALDFVRQQIASTPTGK